MRVSRKMDMNLDRSTIEKINSLKILDVADKLQLGYSAKGSWRKALCFCHDDHHPSLGINPRLSEAEVIWLATGGKSNLSVQALQPLKGMRVILFPDTDAYTDWVKTAQEITEQFGHPITVSNILEQYATDDQKRRKIDLADFIIESR